MQRRVIQVEERVPLLQGIPLSVQHLFAMFGASVLVPTLFHIDPAIVLLMNGIGTMIYLFLCKGKSPAFLGSSFAFLAPAAAIMGALPLAEYSQRYPLVLGGFIVSGLVFTVVAIIIAFWGSNWIRIVLPPAAMGPIVALIGLELAGVAANMAGIIPGEKGLDKNAVIVSMITLGTVLIGTVLFRGFLSTIPVLIGIVVGYVVAIPLGLVHFEQISNASVLALPTWYVPKFDIDAILVILPATLVVLSEHVGHLIVTGNIVGRDLTKNPGLHRSLLGDGISTFISGCCGSVPTTTYGENIGVMAITRVYSVWVIGGAAIISICLAFIGKLSALIMSIPVPVMGGVCLLLFGVIAASGIRMLVEEKVDYSRPANLVLTSLVFIVGISGAYIQIGSVQLRGMALATVTGIILSLTFYVLKKFRLTNEDVHPV